MIYIILIPISLFVVFVLWHFFASAFESILQGNIAEYDIKSKIFAYLSVLLIFALIAGVYIGYRYMDAKIEALTYKVKLNDYAKSYKSHSDISLDEADREDISILNDMKSYGVMSNYDTDSDNDGDVYICTSSGAKRYHCDEYCRGLSNCSEEVIEVTIEEAEDYGLTECHICY